MKLSWSNAPHLLSNDPQHLRFGIYLDAQGNFWALKTAEDFFLRGLASKVLPNNPQHANGVNPNDLGFADPSRAPGQRNVWIDWVSGTVVRQGLPVRVERV